MASRRSHAVVMPCGGDNPVSIRRSGFNMRLYDRLLPNVCNMLIASLARDDLGGASLSGLIRHIALLPFFHRLV